MPEEAVKDEKRSKKTHFAVSWAAIGLGVTMVLIGGIVLLWGLSFQAEVGEPVDLEGDTLVGSPLLIPGGVMSLAFGTLWIHYGLKGFKKKEEEIGKKKCPNCGKMIEEDLNFCYHCTATFSDNGKIGEDDEDVGEEDEDLKEKSPRSRDRSEDEPTKGQVDRAMRQEERRKRREEEREGKKANSLEL